MAQFTNYAITITFRPEFTINDKLKLIKRIPKLLCGHNIYWELSIEYHKYNIKHPFAGKDNPNSPHVHIWLQMEQRNRLTNVEIMILNFKRNYGRVDFQALHTESDKELWIEYLKKDVDKNNLLFPTIKHFQKLIKEI